jgi:F0F1-type ATP synthase assembly protein I
LILGPLLVGVIAFFVKINRHAKAFAEQEQAEALLS